MWTIVITVFLTLLIVVIALNFRRPEKEPHHEVAHLHGIVSPQLRREMGPHIDSETVRVASKRSWGPLLANDAEIYEYEST